jgi:hypothetical protein
MTWWIPPFSGIFGVLLVFVLRIVWEELRNYRKGCGLTRPMLAEVEHNRAVTRIVSERKRQPIGMISDPTFASFMKSTLG